MSGLDDEAMLRVRAHAAAWRERYGQLEVPSQVLSVFRAKATEMHREGRYGVKAGAA